MERPFDKNLPQWSRNEMKMRGVAVPDATASGHRHNSRSCCRVVRRYKTGTVRLQVPLQPALVTRCLPLHPTQSWNSFSRPSLSQLRSRRSLVQTFTYVSPAYRRSSTDWFPSPDADATSVQDGLLSFPSLCSPCSDLGTGSDRAAICSSVRRHALMFQHLLHAGHHFARDRYHRWCWLGLLGAKVHSQPWSRRPYRGHCG